MIAAIYGADVWTGLTDVCVGIRYTYRFMFKLKM